MKILIPVDGSAYTKRMLAYIAAQDDLFGRRHDYVVMTVVAPIQPHAAPGLSAGSIEEHQLALANHVLDPVRAFAKQNGWQIRTVHVVGDAAEAIAAQADAERADLIVMGSHGLTALGSLVLGSVSNAVLARTKVPLLLVR